MFCKFISILEIEIFINKIQNTKHTLTKQKINYEKTYEKTYENSDGRIFR